MGLRHVAVVLCCEVRRSGAYDRVFASLSRRFWSCEVYAHLIATRLAVYIVLRSGIIGTCAKPIPEKAVQRDERYDQSSVHPR